jgi:hypothetical protein
MGIDAATPARRMNERRETGDEAFGKVMENSFK